MNTPNNYTFQQQPELTSKITEDFINNSKFTENSNTFAKSDSGQVQTYPQEKLVSPRSHKDEATFIDKDDYQNPEVGTLSTADNYSTLNPEKSRKERINNLPDSSAYQKQRRAVGKIIYRTVIQQVLRLMQSKPDVDINMKTAFENFYNNQKLLNKSTMRKLLWGNAFGNQEDIKKEDIKKEDIKKEFRRFYNTDYLKGEYVIFNTAKNSEHYHYFLPQLTSKAIDQNSFEKQFCYEDYVSRTVKYCSGQSKFSDCVHTKEQLGQQQNDNLTEISDQTNSTMASLADNNVKWNTPKKQTQSSQTCGQELNVKNSEVNFLTQQQPKNEENQRRTEKFEIDFEEIKDDSVQISRMNSTDENIDTQDLQQREQFQVQEQTPQIFMFENTTEDQNQQYQQEEYREELLEEQVNDVTLSQFDKQDGHQEEDDQQPQSDQKFDSLNGSDCPDYLQPQGCQELSNLDPDQDQPNQEFLQRQQECRQEQQQGMFSEIFSCEADASEYQEEQQFQNETGFEEQPYFIDQQMDIMDQTNDDLFRTCF